MQWQAFNLVCGNDTDTSADELKAMNLQYISQIVNCGTLQEWCHTFGIYAMAVSWETAPTTGRYHLHFYVEYNSLKSMAQVKSAFGAVDVQAAKGKPHQAYEYIKKAGNAVITFNTDRFTAPPSTDRRPQGQLINWEYVATKAMDFETYETFFRCYCMPTSSGYDPAICTAVRTKPAFIKELFNNRSPIKMPFVHAKTAWQQEVQDLCKQPPVNSHRKIINIWSAESGTGKSSIADILRDAGLRVFVFPAGDRMLDAAFMYRSEPVVIFDLPRQDCHTDDLYKSLEIVSDQRVVTSGKYEGRSTRFLAHTVVTSNRALEDYRLPGRITYINAQPLDKENYAEIVLDLSQL